ncbi:FAD-dependent oxidoreductase [Pseudoalteromonas sp. CO348]|uniref:FAD-dependent oxidoreductase n=1 Tax=Pseudoalteromonas sp. CO348 TaxID=1777271 RepID=UPI001022C28C|nr:FAD-dependent oxidoreductase [Pseudoalteromonas sp. CO348]RZG03215.1 FAD-dependent oxidoreductase [Pseudoalteromonas sp. CO348]
MRFQPFWFDEAITQADIEAAASAPPHGALDTQVCIIGGGFTGLWTAITLKKQKPELNIAIIEKDLCGQGASGRNGGAMLTWSTKFASLIKEFGLEQACFLVRQSEQAVHDIKAFTSKHEIECDCRVDGTYYTASNLSQRNAFGPITALLEQHQLNAWQTLDKVQLQATGSNANLAGIYSPHGGSVQPAKLVRGLMKVAKTLGVKVFEHTRYLKHQGQDTLTITTDKGEIRANQLVFAVNAWLPSLLPQFSRSVVLVSSDMAITTPAPEKLAAMRLNHGAPVIDARIFVNYYRTTSSGRLMLGKGGNYFSFNNQVRDTFHRASRYQAILERSFSHFFAPHQLEIERTWTGPSDRSVSGMPFFGHLNGQANVFYGSGYSGNGVVQSYLGGQILASLLLNQHNDWRHCALVNQTLKQFPVEPFRTAGAFMVRNAIRRKESAEDNNTPPHKLDVWLSKLSGSAAKLDSNVKQEYIK